MIQIDLLDFLVLVVSFGFCAFLGVLPKDL